MTLDNKCATLTRDNTRNTCLTHTRVQQVQQVSNAHTCAICRNAQHVSNLPREHHPASLCAVKHFHGTHGHVQDWACRASIVLYLGVLYTIYTLRNRRGDTDLTRT